jgi:hypothetical protein
MLGIHRNTLRTKLRELGMLKPINSMPKKRVASR